MMLRSEDLYVQRAGTAPGADVPVPHQTIQDITAETIGGLHELKSALSQLADRVAGSIPTKDQIEGKSPSMPSLHDQAYSVRTLVSQCHEEMARIQRVL